MAFKQKSQRNQLKSAQCQPRQLQQTSSKQKYRSKFEAGIAATLNKNKVAFSYESLDLKYILSCSYCPDFILGNGIIIETKGYLSKEDRRKMLAVKEANPSLDIRFCFQNAKTKLTRGKKRSLSYGQWATKNGFLWCHKTIPADWY
jgi:hypothetical protein